MQKLKSLTPAAEVFLSEGKNDGFSFRDFLPVSNYFDMPSARENREFDITDITPRFVGYDETAPRGEQALCDVCTADHILDKASADNPNDENLQLLLKRWYEIDEALQSNTHVRKFPTEIAQMKKELGAMLTGWHEAELRRIQNIFLETRKALGNIPAAQFIPRYISRIYMRDEDEQRGEIQEKGGQPIRIGSFVAVSVSPRTCFNRMVFVLGLEPGYHVLAGCGNADNHGSHLYLLRNIRMKLRDDVHRHTERAIKRWQLLYAQTYESALKIKQLNEEQPRGGNEIEVTQSLSGLWSIDNALQKNPREQNLWIEGDALEAMLGDPDRTFRHTVRAILVRKSIMNGEWEVLLVVERGDQKTGGAATKKTGKPPAFGCPGGMVENNETIRRALTRETENEAMTRQVTKIVACVAEYKKAKRPDSTMENIDHWFVIEADREAGNSKDLIETTEIKDVRWVPLSELANFTFQNTKAGRAIWNLHSIMDRKMMYPNHAANLLQILPRIPGIVLPENWDQFEKNLRKFWEENRS